MNDKEWSNLNCHMKCKLICNKEIKRLKTFPTKESIESLKSDVVYKVPFSCVAVTIIDFDEKKNELGAEDWAKIVSAFAFGISKIMKIYKVKHIKVNENSIYGIFDTRLKQQINSLLDCCSDINTFKTHLNKQIDKRLLNRSKCSDDEELVIDFGIGAFFSFNNYVSVVGSSRNKDIHFSGDAINWANKLSRISNTDEYNSILFNQLIFTNLSAEFKKENSDIWDFSKYSDLYERERIYGCDWIYTKYLEWIKGNS